MLATAVFMGCGGIAVVWRQPPQQRGGVNAHQFSQIIDNRTQIIESSAVTSRWKKGDAVRLVTRP
jgi:hypothetical protein